MIYARTIRRACPNREDLTSGRPLIAPGFFSAFSMLWICRCNHKHVGNWHSCYAVPRQRIPALPSCPSVWSARATGVLVRSAETAARAAHLESGVSGCRWCCLWRFWTRPSRTHNQLGIRDLEPELVVFAIGAMDLHKWIHITCRAVSKMALGTCLADLQSHSMCQSRQSVAP